jgi:Ca2+-dependent lipid-binding protein
VHIKSNFSPSTESEEPTSGKLNLIIKEAKLTRDTDTFGKMDPYISLSLREQSFKTKVLKKGGAAPVWDESFDFDVKYIGDNLSLTVFDQDVTSDDKVGEVSIKISSLCTNGGIDEWFEI